MAPELPSLPPKQGEQANRTLLPRTSHTGFPVARLWKCRMAGSRLGYRSGSFTIDWPN